MKIKVSLCLSLFLMSGMGAFSQNAMELPVNTIKGISVAMNGADTLAVFGVTEAWENTPTSFRALACVVPKGSTTDADLESGICYSSDSHIPSVNDGKSKVLTFNKENRVHGVVLNGLNDNKTYYYRVYVKGKDGDVAYGKTYSSTTLSIPTYTNCPNDKHPHLIDLGLPSGTNWACCNVGAKSPEGYGGYYAWGETSEKSEYTWENYAYYNSSTYECVNIGSNIAGTVYDVAHVRMGGSWRMPTLDQQKELITHCTRQWTTQNGVNGTLVTGPNGGQIFLPAAGCRWGVDHSITGGYGYYWSSSLSAWSDYFAYYLYFRSGYWDWDDFSRHFGRSVRAVCP